jgi:8-oxo-dGTP diphosphatase
MASGRRRSGVVLVEDGRVALIRRRRGGRLYHVFPGGGVEADEDDESAAVRETREELGVHVQVVRFLGTVIFGASTQKYYEVCATGGEFGTGTGPEMSSPPNSAAGSYQPIWLALEELADADVRPAALASMLALGSLPASPFAIIESSVRGDS